MRRVVVTGIGSVNPLGADIETSWRNLLAGTSGANTIDKFDTEGLPCRIACSVKHGEDGFNADLFIAPKEQKRVDDFITFAIAGADMALADSGYVADTEEKRERAGVMIGAGIGGLEGIEAGAITLRERGPRRLSPFFIPGSLINLAGGQVSIKHGLKGPNHAVVTACSTGAHAIGDAARIIMWDDADVMVAGGSESAITPLGIAGFAACRALSTGFNDRPTQASRPYDKDRDGFVMGEGSGILVLEELEHAKARGAKIYAEVVGYGMSGDAYHITSPAEDGSGGFRSMRAALKRSGLSPDDISYINAHGTSTPVGDEI
ncbi:MAG: beta-ketoacyl-ACP synthase II, partial [Pseudomonadota bacterium]|nr:beta-ketoacyl-ACP synthase II [Pseudomonadota bacterium]